MKERSPLALRASPSTTLRVVPLPPRPSIGRVAADGAWAAPPQKAGGGTGVRFAGYAALFDRVDQGGDVVRRGAFARAAAKGAVPLLSEHRPGVRIGRVEMLREDRRGLRVIARVDRGAVREGMGLSFGYRVRTSRNGPPRELLDVELVEVSLVNVPMQPGARVHRVVRG